MHENGKRFVASHTYFSITSFPLLHTNSFIQVVHTELDRAALQVNIHCSIILQYSHGCLHIESQLVWLTNKVLGI